MSKRHRLRQQSLDAALYLSPEQAGSIDHDVTETSDLYAAGVTLFHCLAGRPPFTGSTLGAILFEHMTACVPELRAMGIAVPRALDELVGRLLRKDPRDRYQSAEAVLADLDVIAAALAQDEAEPAVVIGALRRPADADRAGVRRARARAGRASTSKSSRAEQAGAAGPARRRIGRRQDAAADRDDAPRRIARVLGAVGTRHQRGCPAAVLAADGRRRRLPGGRRRADPTLVASVRERLGHFAPAVARRAAGTGRRPRRRRRLRLRSRGRRRTAHACTPWPAFSTRWAPPSARSCWCSTIANGPTS